MSVIENLGTPQWENSSKKATPIALLPNSMGNTDDEAPELEMAAAVKEEPCGDAAELASLSEAAANSNVAEIAIKGDPGTAAELKELQEGAKRSNKQAAGTRGGNEAQATSAEQMGEEVKAEDASPAVKTEPPPAPTPVFCEEEYADLQKRYFAKRIFRGVRLAGGQTLRKQTRDAIIDQDHPGFKALKKEIEKLRREGDREEIFRLLKGLAAWEMDPVRNCVPGTKRAAGGGYVAEVIDMTKGDPEVIDVDTFILEVLLMKVVKADPDAPPPPPSEESEESESEGSESEESGTPDESKLKKKLRSMEKELTSLKQGAEESKKPKRATKQVRTADSKRAKARADRVRYLLQKEAKKAVAAAASETKRKSGAAATAASQGKKRKAEAAAAAAAVRPEPSRKREPRVLSSAAFKKGDNVRVLWSDGEEYAAEIISDKDDDYGQWEVRFKEGGAEGLVNPNKIALLD
ncbi:hypothetical protein TeGR_g9470 [Tetraparma gracilis]|uniref:Tudor domain-containing protein n=1 Tax=Tetraparma gracilis TaxID=2962635 RepID=A0ABQ6N4M2_9STRA|nr:hypothetical protein TeGR_g9470 [Tetraparma gracilis]